jgi:hypothetical protein
MTKTIMSRVTVVNEFTFSATLNQTWFCGDSRKPTGEASFAKLYKFASPLQ